MAESSNKNSSSKSGANTSQIREGEDQKAYKKRCEDEKAKVRKGYSGIQEKVKSLRQKFANCCYIWNSLRLRQNGHGVL